MDVKCPPFLCSQHRDDQTKPPVWVGRLAHQLLQGRGEGDRRAVQYDVGQHGVAAAGEQGRQQTAQHRAKGLWATWRGGGQSGELSSLKRNRIFGGEAAGGLRYGRAGQVKAKGGGRQMMGAGQVSLTICRPRGHERLHHPEAARRRGRRPAGGGVWR